MRQRPVADLLQALNGLGADCTSDLGTGSNDYFQGSVAYASLYKLSLTATQVASHYYAA